MSAHVWVACCAHDARNDMQRAIFSKEADAQIIYVADAARMRAIFQEEEPRKVAAAIGLTREGVSDINLAAALVQDGRAREVLLIGRNLSGSLRSRAARAHVNAVIDLRSLSSLAAVPVVDDKPLSGNAMPSPLPIQSKPTRTAVASSISETARRKGQPHAAAVRVGKGEQMPDEQSGAPVLAISSGRGGVGKTTIAALLATVAGIWGLRVALIDLDLACGNLFCQFGLPRAPVLDRLSPELTNTAMPASSLGGSVSSVETNDLLAMGVSAAERVTLWGPCSKPELSERVSPQITTLVTALKGSADLVIVDTSATCTDAVAQVFQLCDRLLLVHDEMAGGIGSLARTSALAVRLGVARTRIVRVANHGDRRSRFDLTCGRAEMGLETARAFRVLDGGEEVADYLAAGKAEELAVLDSDLVSSLRQMLSQILEELGCLPDCEEAHRVFEHTRQRKRRFGLLKRKAS